MLRNTQLILVLWLLVFSVCSLSSVSEAQQEEESESCSWEPVSDENYEWETWNYYEILGLEEPAPPSKTNRKRRANRESIQSKDVRKAYRKQAQLWHPDKMAQKMAAASNETSSAKDSSTEATSIEESNARFARIAEAHQALSDSEKRLDYDHYLKMCEEEQKEKHRQQSATSQWLSNVDPFKVFEEFLFGSNEDDYETDGWSNSRQQHEYHHSSSSAQQQQQQQQQQPVRVSETQQVVVDRYSGREIHRALRMEEYQPDSSGRYYYRIIAQDFAELFDVYQGISLQPLAQPYVQEEGYKQQPSSRTGDTGENSKKTTKRKGERTGTSTKNKKPQQLHHALFPGDILTSTTPLLTSPNGRYYAGLSAECEFLVMADNSKREYIDEDDELIWTSNTALPQHMRRGPDSDCYVTFKGSHLIVAMGGSPPDNPRTILWYSPGDGRHGIAYENDSFKDGSNITYVAQLDSDGSLAVYSLRTIPLLRECKEEGNSDDKWERFSRLAGRLFSDCHSPETRSGKAWVATRNWGLGLLLGRTIKTSSSSTPSVTYKRCVHATGVFGCNRLLRRVSQLVGDITYHMKNLYGRVDRAFDSIMESFLEMDKDEDVLDVVIHLLQNGARHLRRNGRKLAKMFATMMDEQLNKRGTQ